MISNSFSYDVFYVHTKIMFCSSLIKASWFWLTVRKRVFFYSPSFGALALARLLVNDPKKEWEGNANSHKHPWAFTAHPCFCMYKFSHPHIWKLETFFLQSFLRKLILFHLQNLHDLDIPHISFCNCGPIYKFYPSCILEEPYIHIIPSWPLLTGLMMDIWPKYRWFIDWPRTNEIPFQIENKHSESQEKRMISIHFFSWNKNGFMKCQTLCWKQ